MNTTIARLPANPFHALLLAFLSLVLGNLVSCGSHQNLIIYQADAALVALRELPAGYPSLGPHNHPRTIPPKAVLTLIEPLEYREGAFFPFAWGQPRRVFSGHQAELLAQELSKAFGLALPQEVVAFTVVDEETPDRRTKGLSFVLGDELHLIIEELRQPSYQGEQKTYQQQTHRWELIPGHRQRLFTSRPGGKGMAPHWVICPLTQ